MCQSQVTQQHTVWATRAFPHTIPYGGGQSTSYPPSTTIKRTSSTTATVPCLSIAKLRIIRRLYICANHKLHSNIQSGRPGHSHIPYHMVADSRPHTLLLRP